jgi:hypothetical protein
LEYGAKTSTRNRNDFLELDIAEGMKWDLEEMNKKFEKLVGLIKIGKVSGVEKQCEINNYKWSMPRLKVVCSNFSLIHDLMLNVHCYSLQ